MSGIFCLLLYINFRWYRKQLLSHLNPALSASEKRFTKNMCFKCIFSAASRFSITNLFYPWNTLLGTGKRNNIIYSPAFHWFYQVELLEGDVHSIVCFAFKDVCAGDSIVVGLYLVRTSECSLRVVFTSEAMDAPRCMALWNTQVNGRSVQGELHCMHTSQVKV